MIEVRRRRRFSFSILYLLFSILYLLFLPGCRSSYTDENLEQSIIGLCKREYKIDVMVKRVGRTVGIYLPVNGLFETSKKIKGRIETLEDVVSGIKFTKDAVEKIEDVSMALSRVALSTDAPVDFYVLIVADKKAYGLQIIITRYTMDMKRLILGDVSRGDYAQRLLMDMDFGPVSAAEESVRDFFYDLQKLQPAAVITRYFSRLTNARIESPDFFLYLSELQFKASRRFYISDIKNAQIEKNKVLVKCRVKEVFTPLAGHENFKFLQSSGSTSEYLILIDTSYIPYMFERVAPVVAGQPYPEQFRQYENPDSWAKNGFFLEEVTVPDFLARQLANRIKELYQSDPRFKNKFIVTFVKGEYQAKTRRFKIIIDAEPKNIMDASGIRNSLDFDAIRKIVSDVLRRYEFNDYDSVEIFNLADAKREVINRQDLLDRYWPKWRLKSQK